MGGPLSAATCFREEACCSQPRGGSVLPLIKAGLCSRRVAAVVVGARTNCLLGRGAPGQEGEVAPGGSSRLLLAEHH